MFREIRAIAAGVLGNHNQLLHAGIGKLLCLCQHVLHPPGAVLAPQGGNHAIGALIVASFGNLDVSIVLGGGENAPGLHLRGIDAAEIANRPVFQQLFNGGDNLCVAARAQQTVHLRHFLCNLSLIALGEAAGNQNLANLALGFHGTGHENVVNCLRLCRVDKSTGVDNHHVAAGKLTADRMASLLYPEHHPLTVHLIFCTAKRNKTNYSHFLLVLRKIIGIQ